MLANLRPAGLQTGHDFTGFGEPLSAIQRVRVGLQSRRHPSKQRVGLQPLRFFASTPWLSRVLPQPLYPCSTSRSEKASFFHSTCDGWHSQQPQSRTQSTLQSWCARHSSALQFAVPLPPNLSRMFTRKLAAKIFPNDACFAKNSPLRVHYKNS